jgi:hypothetical protein
MMLWRLRDGENPTFAAPKGGEIGQVLESRERPPA